MYRKTLRPAVAMIELIFAIVVMGIVMMSAPMLVGTATKSGYVTIQQEGINEAASRVNMIMGYAWDENNTNSSYMPPILNTDSPTAGLGEVITPPPPALIHTGRRIGIPAQSQRTYFVADSTVELAASPLGGDNLPEVPDDIDDFIGNTNLVVAEAGAAIDYIETNTINIATAVAYTTDNVLPPMTYNNAIITYVPFIPLAPNTTSNIKSITVTLTSNAAVNELSKTIILRAFSCNIGGYKLESRVF